ncbi:multicopper oxidase family protein [Devosia rhodophyticola]|uniref:Multicopper oxidase family protein n=1 Tax=Devosia rhodophyticola TaxID=3026423 RepID=A0ABY7YZ14_9HYPH|nr:multicopper oxidase family protein [Devosia rhodophyticola]WDR06487.1 multicopper oxidase family protein [Devosia rhodophyticola]
MSFTLSRRAFLGSAAILGTAAIFPPRLAFGSTHLRPLTIEKRVIEVLGKSADVFGISGPDGKPGLTLAADERFAVSLSNQSGETSIVHWHGQTPTPELDGVALTGYVEPLSAGEVRGYDFAARPGTHWMHSHQGMQEQRLMAAPLVVRTAEDEAADMQEVTVLLHDFSFASPEEILAGLRTAQPDGMMPGMDMSSMGSMQMGTSMMSMDLNDVNYDAYLANDRTLDDPEVVRTERNGRVRLRLINGATATAFWIDLGDTPATVLAVDGNEVMPVAGTRFPLAQAQRMDLLIEVAPGAVVPVFAEREGARERTGVILASPGASVAKFSNLSDTEAPPVDISLETRLRAKSGLSPAKGTKASVMLMGDMSPYSWNVDGNTWPNHRPIGVKLGDRVELELMNHSMMAHPMHLHGHHFQVTSINGKALAGAVRDTILLPPMTRVTLAFDADNPGRWLFHCHNLYHMATGMMTELIYT